jgi:hypothetical protein
MISFGLLVPVLLIGGGAIRMLSTVLSLVTNPLDTIRQMPQNWLRQSLCTDFFFPPEIVPNERFDDELPNFAGLMREFRENLGTISWREPLDAMVWAFFLPLLIVIWYVPPIIYRLSFKEQLRSQ